MSTVTQGEQARPLFMVNDSQLLEELLRLTTAAGVLPEVVPDATAARRAWLSAPTVVVDQQAAAACQRLRFVWRTGVILAGYDSTDGRGSAASSSEADARSIWQLASEVGAAKVALLPAAEKWLVDRLSRRGVEAAERVMTTVCVTAGRGGGGASLLSTALAVTATRLGHRVLLIDADPLGAGLDLTLGHESMAGARWSEFTSAHDLSSAASVFDALPRVGELRVLAWNRAEVSSISAATMNMALDISGSGTDLVVVDIPRYPDEASVAALARSDRTLLVVPAEVRATFSANRVASVLSEHSETVECVVRGPAPSRLNARDIATALQLPLAGYVKAEPRLVYGLENGTVVTALRRGHLAGLSRRILATLDINDLHGGDGRDDHGE